MPRLRPLALALTLGLAAPQIAPGLAQAESLVIEGRAAQALHCATMMAVIGGAAHDAGLLSDSDFEMMAFASMRMMEHVPGSPAQKKQAMVQRGEKLIRTRSLDQLVNELDRTLPWCMDKFL